MRSKQFCLFEQFGRSFLLPAFGSCQAGIKDWDQSFLN